MVFAMLINLRPNLTGPLYRQLFDSLRLAIVEGQLHFDQQLPPSRELAQQLSLSRNTVNTAYDMLRAEGYIRAHQGSGYFVSAQIPESLTSARPKSEPEPLSQNPQWLSNRGKTIGRASRPVTKLSNPAFQPGLPDLNQFPYSQWQRCVNHCLKQNDLSLYKYNDQGGYAPLKEALRNYLHLARGVNCLAEQIIIVNGSQAGLDLITRMLIDNGDRVAMEEPGYLGAKDGFEAAGAKLIPIAVDEQGLSINQLKKQRRKIKLVYTTPSYQFPLGVTMSLQRRGELLQWAEQHQAFVIEDDYDSEFRFKERPISSLQGLDPHQRVIYLGTLSKVMFPGLRLGFMVVPRHLSSAFANALRKTGQDAPLLWQAALTQFINEGYFNSHIRKMRNIYAEKQDTLVKLIRQHLSDWLSVEPTAAGMQLPVYFKKKIDNEEFARKTAKQNIILPLLSRFYAGAVDRQGLYLGYSGVPLAEMETNVLKLKKILSHFNR